MQNPKYLPFKKGMTQMREAAYQASVSKFARSLGLTVFRNEEGDGRPDVTIFGRHCKTRVPVCLHLEFKTVNGKLTKRQTEMKQRMEFYGFPHYVPRSHAEGCKIIREVFGYAV